VARSANLTSFAGTERRRVVQADRACRASARPQCALTCTPTRRGSGTIHLAGLETSVLHEFDAALLGADSCAVNPASLALAYDRDTYVVDRRWVTIWPANVRAPLTLSGLNSARCASRRQHRAEPGEHVRRRLAIAVLPCGRSGPSNVWKLASLPYARGSTTRPRCRAQARGASGGRRLRCRCGGAGSGGGFGAS